MKTGETKKAYVYRVRDMFFDKENITFPLLVVKEGADMTKVKAVANVEEADTPPAVNIEEQAEKDKPEKKESLYFGRSKGRRKDR